MEAIAFGSIYAPIFSSEYAKLFTWQCGLEPLKTQLLRTAPEVELFKNAPSPCRRQKPLCMHTQLQYVVVHSCEYPCTPIVIIYRVKFFAACMKTTSFSVFPPFLCKQTLFSKCCCINVELFWNKTAETMHFELKRRVNSVIVLNPDFLMFYTYNRPLLTAEGIHRKSFSCHMFGFTLKLQFMCP